MASIRLFKPIPVSLRRRLNYKTDHEVVRKGLGGRGIPLWYVKDVDGKEVGIMKYEAEEIDDN